MIDRATRFAAALNRSPGRPIEEALRVNQQKRALAPVEERKFLGYRLGADGTLGIAPKSLQRTKARLRQITKRLLVETWSESAWCGSIVAKLFMIRLTGNIVAVAVRLDTKT